MLDDFLLWSLMNSITKGWCHQLVKGLKNAAELRKTLVKIKLGNIKTTFILNLWS